MGDYHIGKLIRGFRESKSITRKVLYYGLTDTRHVSKMENGEQEMSKLLVDVLLERMGLSTDMYGYVFSIKEYQLFQTRADILELLEKGEYIEAESLCDEYEKMSNRRDRLEKQFIRTIRLLIVMQKEIEPKDLLQEAQEILFLTIPKFDIGTINDYMLSGMERMLVALQAEAYCRMNNRERGMDVYYYSLLFHLERYCTDPWEKERQIPPLIMIMARWLWKWERYSEMQICHDAIKIQRNGMRLTLLEPLMEYEMKAWATGCVSVPEGESEKEWKAGLEALAEVRKEYKVPRRHTEENMDTSLFILMMRQNYRGQILGDVVRRIRMEKGMTVEELADGVCEPEHLRKIELGTMKPREKTYSQLMKKLGQSEYAYHPVICSDDYRMYESYLEICYYMNRFEYDKAEYELRKLKGGLGEREKSNQQILIKLNAIINEKQGRITKEEKLKFLKMALEITIPKEVETSDLMLNRVEIGILNSMASCLEGMGLRKEAMRILMLIKNGYQQSGVEYQNNMLGYMMVMKNLTGALGRELEHDKALEMVQKGIELSLKWGQGIYLIEYLYSKMWNLEYLLESEGKSPKEIEEICLNILKQDFHIASLMKYTSHMRHIERHCDKCYKSVKLKD